MGFAAEIPKFIAHTLLLQLQISLYVCSSCTAEVFENFAISHITKITRNTRLKAIHTEKENIAFSICTLGTGEPQGANLFITSSQ